MDQTISQEPAGREPQTATTPARPKRTKAPVVIAIVAIIAAVVFGALFATSRVPDGSAAKLNDSYISESDVDAYISQYRLSHQLTDDTALAQALSSQGMSVAQFRINAIDQLAIEQLVEARASELGVSADESKVDEQISSAKSSLAFNDDSIWERTLQQYGMTEDQLRAQYRSSLLQRAVCERDVPRREATDDETLSFAKSQLAGSQQKHYTRLVFSGDDPQKLAQDFSAKFSRYQATRSFKNAKDIARAMRAQAKKSGASVKAYGWTLDLDSSDSLTQTLGNLDVSDTSGVETDDGENTASLYLCDESYDFPDAKSISSLKKSDLPKSLWKSAGEKASEALWNSDCSAYVAKLLAQAKVTYYPVPDDAPYNVDLSSASASSSADSSESAQSSGAN